MIKCRMAVLKISSYCKAGDIGLFGGGVAVGQLLYRMRVKGKSRNGKVTPCWRHLGEGMCSFDALCHVKGRKAAVDSWQILLTRFSPSFLGDLLG